jgi:hypothetical protein
MHVEPLEKLPRSVREFLSHYAMIVLSILTALALEQVALGVEHHHEGERARHEIDLEIASNRQAVEGAMTAVRAYATSWEALLARTVAEVNAGRATNETLLATIVEARHHFGDATPPLKTAAWDAALSDHSVDYLEHDELTRYSNLYASQRFFSQALWDMVRDSASRNLSALTLPTLLRKADPVATVALLNERVRTLRIMESQLSQMDDVMKGAAEPSAKAAAIGSAPAPASAASR